MCLRDQLLPLQWLKQIWMKRVKSVTAEVAKAGADMNENEVGELSEMEAKNSLKETKGDVEEAVKICTAKRCKLVSLCSWQKTEIFFMLERSGHYVYISTVQDLYCTVLY